jgi:hypothetical protein
MEILANHQGQRRSFSAILNHSAHIFPFAFAYPKTVGINGFWRSHAFADPGNGS